MMFPAYFWRSILVLWLALAGLLGTAVWVDNHQDAFASFPQAQSPMPHDTAMVAKGQQLLQLGNCMACHTQRGGPAGAGGRAFETPFGKVYSSNITPQIQDGLGLWNANDFGARFTMANPKMAACSHPCFPISTPP
jgi:mono/diheme cytochrome c family protein